VRTVGVDYAVDGAATASAGSTDGGVEGRRTRVHPRAETSADL